MEHQQLSETQAFTDTDVSPHDEASGSHSKPILVRRMFEVFCISIHRDLDFDFESTCTYPTTYKLKSVYDGNPCHIYGLIRAFSEDGQTFIDIYNRGKDNCEVVEFGGFLSITNSYVISPTYLKVVVYLYDMAHDAEIANGVFEVDYHFELYRYNELEVEWVNGQHGFAFVRHSTFQHAVVANLDRVVLNKLDEADDSDASDGMLSAVSARLERTDTQDEAVKRIFPSYTIKIVEFPTAILFSGSHPVEFGVPVRLFRSSIVVPAFCSLVISFHGNNGHRIVEDMSLDVMNGGLIEMRRKGQCCEVVLEGEWKQGYASEPTHPVLSEKESSLKIASAIPNVFPCVEIFSVLLWLNDDYVDIKGSATMTDSSNSPFHIFQGEETWSSGIALPISGPPRSFDAQPFIFQTKILDETDQFVSEGSFKWNLDNDDDDDDDDRSMSLYNKPLCSVVRGDVGYAALHYSVIPNGIQAKISLSIAREESSPNFSVEISGEITAEYGGYSYHTPYDRKYYKSTVFNQPKTECIKVNLMGTWIELPLRKPVISVPLNELLVLDVNLMVFIPGAHGKANVTEAIIERLKFETDGDTSDQIVRDNFSIDFRVYISDTITR